MSKNKFSTGIIEGFYGKPWSWNEREDMLKFLKSYNYSYYIYAPKNDKKLRDQWQKPWSAEEYEKLKKFQANCRENSIEFGIGLSPFELYLNWTDRGKKRLKDKLNEINSLGADIIWILFDDMIGNRENMASIQIEITHFIQEHSKAKSIAICPTYYSFDPGLKSLFGQTPKRYLLELGSGLKPDIDIIWTGPKISSEQIPSEHLVIINTILKRKVLLWDNVFVNDCPRRTPFLYLKSRQHIKKDLRSLISAHTINPMVQPNLSKIPLASISDLYFHDNYDHKSSWDKNSKELLGEEFSDLLKEDINDFENRGVGVGDNYNALNDWKTMLEDCANFKLLTEKEQKDIIMERLESEKRIKRSFTKEEKKKLIVKYSLFNNKYSREIISWLMGYYFFDPQILS